MTNLTEKPILSDNITHERSMKNSSHNHNISNHIPIHQVNKCCISYCNVVHTLPEVGRPTIPSTCKVDMSAAAVDWEDWLFFSTDTAAACCELDMLSVECSLAGQTFHRAIMIARWKVWPARLCWVWALSAVGHTHLSDLHCCTSSRGSEML